MRLAIMSDIHGNLAALEAVLADIAARGPCDALGVAGDLCEWGPQPHEVLARVRDLGCPVVQGNTDRNVTFADDEARLRALGKNDHSIKGLAWTCAQLGPAGVDYL
ncbi:MAG: metallophosphatase family protein, partial [Chloroflexi bacterium]|nr:metallophosphatase family protein [Chloroflexota bacterium]